MQTCFPTRFVNRLDTIFSLAIVLLVLSVGSAWATRIDSAGDPALSGATIVNFDDPALTDTYFAGRDFGLFQVNAAANELHIDGDWCDDFGTSGNCLDTMDAGNAANDDFEVIFTDAVSAFGFVLNALDTDWTIETFNEAGDSLGVYVVASQSPALAGFLRQGYFGATETEAIKSFTVSSVGSDRALIDDFAVVPVPEPGSGVLCGLGLVGLAWTERRFAAR